MKRVFAERRAGLGLLPPLDAAAGGPPDSRMDERALAFLGVATLLTITPGPDMALVTRNVLRGGTRAGLLTSVGILCGLVAWAMLAALGVAAMLAASATAFAVLKLLGAAYLVYLGLLTLWESRKAAPPLASPDPCVTPGGMAHFRQGLLSNLTNPKVGIFYTTLLPQFIMPGSPVAAWTTLLAALHLSVSVLWLACFSMMVAGARQFLARQSVRLALQWVTGFALDGLGLRVARDAVGSRSFARWP